MQRIESNEMKSIGTLVKKYYDLPDMRMMVADNYSDQEGWHKHDVADQVIFVICGSLQISVKDTETINERILHTNEFMYLPSGELHKV